jgi:type II secretory pathway pseudopilin PulG
VSLFFFYPKVMIRKKEDAKNLRAGRPSNSGLALIELLIVSAVIAVIFMMFTPFFVRSYEKSRELSDTGSMHLAILAAEVMHAEGKLATAENQMFYDAESGKITTEIPAEGYGRGTVVDMGGNTIYAEENCGCNYDSTLSYRHAYLTIFYDETTRRVHAHWVGVAGAASREVNVRRKKGRPIESSFFAL